MIPTVHKTHLMILCVECFQFWELGYNTLYIILGFVVSHRDQIHFVHETQISHHTLRTMKHVLQVRLEAKLPVQNHTIIALLIINFNKISTPPQ